MQTHLSVATGAIRLHRADTSSEKGQQESAIFIAHTEYICAIWAECTTV